MSHDQGWSWQPAKMTSLLRGLGYDVDPSDADETPGSLRGRRDRGARSHVVVLDAGGRFRAQVTRAQEETRRVVTIAGIDATLVRATEQTDHVTATLTDPDQLAPILQSLDEIGFLPMPSNNSGARDRGPAWHPAPLPPPPDHSGR